jgi:hypothetical protein
VEHFSGPRLISFQDANLASRAHTPAETTRRRILIQPKREGMKLKLKKRAFYLTLCVALGVFTNQHRGPDSRDAQLRRGQKQFN